MTLTLQIENVQTLDPSGPTRIRVPPEGLSAGRGATMGWVLPDASRHISSHHFDVYRDGAGCWWLRDVSTNGTFLQGQRYRLEGPHPLCDGDRFQVGQYLIVALVAEDARPAAAAVATVASAAAAAAAPAAVAPAAPQAREITGIRPPADSGPAADFVTAFCNGAGLPPDLYGDVDPSALAQALGQAIRRVSGEVMLALQDRAAAKQFARTGERTMQAPSDNNPLKFLPAPDQAIEAMFLRPRPGFQSGPDGLEEALSDLRRHQAAMFAALQPALAGVLQDLSPEAIEPEAEATRQGGNRHAHAWELFAARWAARAEAYENGMQDAFLHHFAASYRMLVDQSRGGAGSASPDPAGGPETAAPASG